MKQQKFRLSFLTIILGLLFLLGCNSNPPPTPEISPTLEKPTPDPSIPTPSFHAIGKAGQLTLYGGPGNVYNQIDTVKGPLNIVGQSTVEDELWLQIEVQETSRIGWVQAKHVQVNISLEEIPNLRAPQELLQEMSEMLSTVCKRESILEAGTYSTRDRFHPTIILDEQGKIVPEQLKLGWWRTSMSEIELVACIDQAQEKVIEICRYSGGKTIERYRISRMVTLREARTGQVVAEERFIGSLPSQCSAAQGFVGENTQLKRLGDDVRPSTILNWLKTFVEK